MEESLRGGCSVEASGESRGGCDEVEVSITSEEGRKGRGERDLIGEGGGRGAYRRGQGSGDPGEISSPRQTHHQHRPISA